MRKISAAITCIAGVFLVQGSFAGGHSKEIAFHWIYVKQGATIEQFQSDRDQCSQIAKQPRYANGIEYSPSSTVFLNCMDRRGYTLSKEGWDTGVLWTKPYRRPGGPN